MCLCWGRLWRLELCRLYMLLGLDRLLGLNRRVLGLNRCGSGEYVWEGRDHGSDCRPGADIVILSRGVLAEKLTVPLGHSPGAIDTDQVCVVGVDFQDNSSLGPESSMGASFGLILYATMTSRLEGSEGLGTLGQLLLLEHPPLGVCHLTLGGSEAPLLPGDKLARLQGKEVPEDPAKDYLSRAEASQVAGSVPVL